METKGILHNVYFIKTPIRDTRALSASFFVRINTRGLSPFFFNEHKQQASSYSVAAEIAKMQWMQIPNHYPQICLDSFSINSYSIQGIVLVDIDETSQPLAAPEIGHLFHFPPPRLLMEAFTHYKASCSRAINKAAPDLKFGWQPLFTSLVITNSRSLGRFREYINNK
jgi:hypothetical protein